MEKEFDLNGCGATPNPSIKKGDILIDNKGNLWVVGKYGSNNYFMNMDTGEDTYSCSSITPKHYRKLVPGDILTIIIK